MNSSGVDEIVVTTYKGWVFGLTPEMQDVIIHSSDAPLPIVVNDTQTQKVAELESEIKDMQTNLAKEKEKFQQLSANAKSGQAYSAAAPFSGVFPSRFNDFKKSLTLYCCLALCSLPIRLNLCLHCV